MSEALLEVADIHVAYGQVEAVRGVSLKVPKGQIATVIGPNGAGKTTLLGAIMGLLPAKGEVRFAGERIDGRDTEALVRRGISLVPEKRELFADMTVQENLELGGFSRRRAGESRAALATPWKRCLRCSRASRSACRNSPAPCPAANARCSRLAAR